MLNAADTMYIIESMFGEDAIINDIHQNADSIYVHIVDSSVRKPGDYLIRRVADKDDHWGFMVESLTFVVLPAREG